MMIKLPNNFTKEKEKLLKEMYYEESKENILEVFNTYKWRNLQNIANFLKIKRKRTGGRKGNLSILLNETLESSYWLGLFCSDGSLIDDYTFKIDLAVSDQNYLSNLANYLNTNLKIYPPYKENTQGICRVKIRDVKVVSEIKNLFKIKDLKTYNPVNIDFLKDDNFLAFLIGYIDGDGSVNKLKQVISIDAHKNIFPLFNHIKNNMLEFNKDFNIHIFFYKDMVRLNFNKKCSQFLHDFVNKSNLPVMNRKWDLMI